MMQHFQYPISLPVCAVILLATQYGLGKSHRVLNETRCSFVTFRSRRIDESTGSTATGGQKVAYLISAMG